MKLFLSSFFSGAAGLFDAFTGNTCAGKTAVFIPTASKPEKMAFYVGSDKKALARLGMVVDELDVSETAYGETAERIAAADYVFVGGGNTFFLLRELKRSGADKLIVEHVRKGKLYIGASAGSMILSENIGYVKHMDSPAAAPDLNGDFSALAVVDFCVVPHAANFPFKRAVKKILTECSGTYDLRPISNNQAVTVDGGAVEILTAAGKKQGLARE
ncbi:MAG: Type 1 glutamine amidotransferase-like domain-containing protein [Peptococcaceae bacterium]|jgi:dipeptidase E|nr:Type 1 glutamine amidotransferase-like domain-containing protein [Peptococcaceae bacterium]